MAGDNQWVDPRRIAKAIANGQRASTPQTDRDRLAALLAGHVIRDEDGWGKTCCICNGWTYRSKESFTKHVAFRLTEAGFGDVAKLREALEARDHELAALRAMRTRLAVALNRIVGSVTLVEAEADDGEVTEFWVASPDALEQARAALGGPADATGGGR